jgi:hypothetical protein
VCLPPGDSQIPPSFNNNNSTVVVVQVCWRKERISFFYSLNKMNCIRTISFFGGDPHFISSRRESKCVFHFELLTRAYGIFYGRSSRLPPS